MLRHKLLILVGGTKRLWRSRNARFVPDPLKLFIKNLVDLLLTAVLVRRNGIFGAMGQGWNMSRVSLA
jgi:hypothetical protein